MKEEKIGLTQEHYPAMILYDFKVGLNQEECFQGVQLVFANGALSRATVFRWFTEFRRRWNFLLDEEHTGSTLSSVVPENVSAVRKMLIHDYRWTYQMILNEL